MSKREENGQNVLCETMKLSLADFLSQPALSAAREIDRIYVGKMTSHADTLAAIIVRHFYTFYMGKLGKALNPAPDCTPCAPPREKETK